jgi:hypothetical protein
MRVRFERTGGFAGTRLACDLDDTSLPPEERGELCDLVAGADFFSLPARMGASGHGADQFSYRIAIDEGGRAHAVVSTDEEVPEALEALVEWLVERARGGA